MKTFNKKILSFTFISMFLMYSSQTDTNANKGILIDGTYEISSLLDNNKALGIENCSKEDCSKIQLYDRNNTEAQQFNIVYDNNGYYTVQSKCSGKMLDVPSSSKRPFTKIWQYNRNDTDAQKWRIVHNSDDSYSIISKCNGLYLDVTSSSTKNGTPIQCYIGNGTKAQKFKLKKYQKNLPKPFYLNKIFIKGIYEISSLLDNNKALDIQNCSKEDCAKIQLYDRNNTAAQQFNIIYDNNGYYTIQSKCSGKMLDVPNSSKSPGTKIWQYDDNDTDAQKWRIVHNSDGSYSIISKCNGLYLDVTSSGTKNGTPIQCYVGNGTKAQKFKLKKYQKNLPKVCDLNGLSCGNIELYISCLTKPNSILLVEFNPYHHECIPGYSKYFIELGYNVDVLILKGYEDCFDLFGENGKLKIYTFENYEEIHDNELIISNKINKYERVFLNSIEAPQELINSLNIIDVPHSLAVAHSTDTVNNAKLKNFLKVKRIVTLGKFDIGTYINPHYFGKIKSHLKNGKVNFVVVGNIHSTLRNYDILIKSVTELKNKGLDFRITVLGRYGELTIPEEIKKFFNFKGRLSYKEMYQEINKVDFILLLLDNENDCHLCYKKTKVTGNTQLSYGFAKPPIIAEEFSGFYLFNSKNSFVYKNNELTGAMEKAIKCTSNEYKSIQENLERLAFSIFQESLNNLKTIVKYG